MNPTLQLTRAYNFAAQRHVHQRGKGEAAEPYMNHLTEVADLVAQATGGEIDIVVAAILHDTLDDTGTTLDELRSEFGSRVASFVEDTDDKSLSKQTRKELQIQHAAHASWGAQVIKHRPPCPAPRVLPIRLPFWPGNRIGAGSFGMAGR